MLVPGGVIGIVTSLGGESGWELVPAGPARVPTLEASRQRWFVHHHQDQVEADPVDAGWTLDSDPCAQATESGSR